MSKQDLLYPSIADLPERVVKGVNSIHSYLFVLFLLLFFFFHIEPLANEEGLMQIAKYLYDPAWLSHCFDPIEKMGPRLLYQYPTGFLLKYFSFESVIIAGGFILSLLLAYPLFKIYRLLELSNTEILLHLPLLYFPRQSFFAGEFMFLSFESKAFAYVFVLLAVYYLLREKTLYVTLSGIAATYFHVIVGGWFMFYFLLYHFFTTRSLKKTTRQGLLYAVGIIPLFFLMLRMISINFSSVSTPVDLDWIFTYFRQPHHTALFASMSYFVRTHLQGVLLSLTFFIISLLVFSQFKNRYNLKINRFNLLIFSGTAVCLLLSSLDKNGVFVKYFPFRMNALFAFLAFLQVTFLVRHYFLDKRYFTYFQFGILSFFLLTLAPRQAYRLSLKAYKAVSDTQSRHFDEICDYIRLQTPQDAVVLLVSEKSTHNAYEPGDSEAMLYCLDMDISFTRKAERRRYTSFKFVNLAPGDPRLYDWYLKVLKKIEIAKNMEAFCRIYPPGEVDYLLTDFEWKQGECYELSYHNRAYFLYKIKDQP